MSYILEALKKSQQERELGQVPTLETTVLFSDDKESVPTSQWALLAVGLAALAVVIALFAAVRDPAPSPAVLTDLTLPDSSRVATPTPTIAESQGARQRKAGAPSSMPSGYAPIAPLAEPPPPKRSAPPVAVSPVPALSSPSGRVATPSAAASQDAFADYPNPNLDPALELELQRQLEAESVPSEDQVAPVVERPQHAPVPADLIDEIESFKQQVRREQGLPPPKTQASVPLAHIDGDPTRLQLTPEQRAQVPMFLMTVHVYHPDTAKRFVLINALKYREGEETREGLRVERILPEGAVLSHRGNLFYISR